MCTAAAGGGGGVGGLLTCAKISFVLSKQLLNTVFRLSQKQEYFDRNACNSHLVFIYDKKCV